MMILMRTTVTLDHDVEKLLRRAVHERDQSFKTGFEHCHPPRALLSGKAQAVPAKNFPPGLPAPGVNLTKALALTDALEDAEMTRKLEIGK